MFGLGKKKGFTHNDLEELRKKLEINMGNNYKDASKDAFKRMKTKYDELLSQGKLSFKQEQYYETVLKDYEKELANFNH